MKKLLAGAVVSALLGGPASAADILVTPAPAYQPPVAVVARLTWTGCYFGINGGGLWVRNDSTFAGPTFGGSPALGASLGGHTASGWVAGAQMGCNYQVGNWVFGAQGGFDWADAKGSHPDPFFVLTTDTSRTRQLMEMTWRIGYAWGRFLGYVKAGAAWERIDYAMLTTAIALNAFVARETGGWSVGIGGEYAINEWLSAFMEYRYLDFGTCTDSFVNGFGAAVANVNVRDTKNVVKAGLNLRFGP
jgi:outer membrane immunogenic protein